MRIKLGDEDREKFGVTDDLDFKLHRVTLKESRHLKNETGFDVSSLDEAFRLGKATDEHVAALVWLALRANGVNVSWDVLDFHVWETEFKADEDPKAQSGTTNS